MTTIDAMDTEDLVEAIERWAEGEPAHRRAAAWALVKHRHWLYDSQFGRWCLAVDDDDNVLVSVIWSHAQNMLRRGELTGSPSEIAMLRFCVELAIDDNGLQSLDAENRAILLNATWIALTR